VGRGEEMEFSAADRRFIYRFLSPCKLSTLEPTANIGRKWQIIHRIRLEATRLRAPWFRHVIFRGDISWRGIPARTGMVSRQLKPSAWGSCQ